MRKIYSLLAVVIFMVIAGCSNSSDSTSPPLSSEKAITQFSLDGVAGIIDETEKTIAVSLPAGSSVTALVATFTTSGAIVTVASIAQVSGETDNDFTSPVVYTVTAADNSTQDYTVTVKAWGTATLIETDNLGDYNALLPQVVMDASGNAVAVWSQFDGGRYNIWSNRYTNGTGWGTATLIETNIWSLSSYQVAMDASGNAVVVWSQDDGTRNNILSNRYTNGTGWGTATLIETDNVGRAYGPQVAVDASGNAVAVWHQSDESDGTWDNIWSNRYTAGTGWGTATLIATNVWPWWPFKLAMNASGNAVVVWSQLDGSRSNILSNHYTNETGWSTSTLIETDMGDAFAPQVAVDASGNAVAVWVQSDGTRDNIRSNCYTAGIGWERARLIETDNVGGAYNPKVAVVSGNAVVVWSQSDGTRSNIWSNRYIAGTGWGTATLIETDNMGGAFDQQVAVDASGNAVAVWAQFDGMNYNIWSNRYTPWVGWGTATLIESDMGNASAPQVAVDASGNAVAVWYQYVGWRDSIWSNSYR